MATGVGLLSDEGDRLLRSDWECFGELGFGEFSGATAYDKRVAVLARKIKDAASGGACLHDLLAKTEVASSGFSNDGGYAILVALSVEHSVGVAHLSVGLAEFENLVLGFQNDWGEVDLFSGWLFDSFDHDFSLNLHWLDQRADCEEEEGLDQNLIGWQFPRMVRHMGDHDACGGDWSHQEWIGSMLGGGDNDRCECDEGVDSQGVRNCG